MQLETRGAFDINSFCRWADIGRSHVYAEAQRGRLRLTKCGRKTLITVADAQAWLDALPKLGGEASE
jgi:hypothetical protein